MSEGPLKDLLVDGIIGGVGGVIVLPAEYFDFVFLHIFDGGFRIYGACKLLLWIR